ncbi:MAG: Arm DNA-binding domain-containing protein, partial [Bacteroidia bacterium]
MSSVKLRTKVVKQGISLYLDIYNNGQRKYEFLKLYYEDKPKTAEAKQHKKEALSLAEQIRAKRLLQLEQNRYDLTPAFKAKVLLIDFFEAAVKDKKNAGNKIQNWL